jgi:vacuolar-type H+-ATPase subunit E/Vma4
MRNAVDQELLRRVGQLPHMVREDLRAFLDAWYKQEQERLTTLAEDVQLRQAQGSAQVLRDISAVLKNPEAYANTARSRPTQLP